MSVVDRCARCSHIRGVHQGHQGACMHTSGCDCSGFVEAETQAVLSSPAGVPWWVA